jgi:hypothetical protein
MTLLLVDVIFFSETTFPREVSYFSRRAQTAKSLCLRNMVGVQEFPNANMPEGPWQWWSHTSQLWMQVMSQDFG